ncbi:uncharacterized protein LOC110640819 isoform X2 [Hevea brasiliensis]|uniref:uncharacterized protein LOC110640819 isoform X2 n=1 Tax=Hevea brasiliensis TaxID=3981 RepID=UPI0025D4EC5D|nr:uncharacterized protein LOC110640819 isoform X2 [Hevea brasiliensis]
MLYFRDFFRAVCGACFIFLITTTGIESKRCLHAENIGEGNIPYDKQQTTNATQTDRISGKARIKALIAKEASARSRLQRTHSIHHLGTSDGLDGISSDWTNPIIILHKSADPAASGLQIQSLPKSPKEKVTYSGKYNLSDTMNDQGCLKQHFLSEKQELSAEKGDKLMNASLNRNFSDAKQLFRGISSAGFMEYVDVLELFKVNKKLFLEILQDPDVQAANNIHVQLNSHKTVRLKKSGSFPLADSPSTRFLRPSTLEHKQKEIWSYPREENFPAKIEVPKFVASNSSEDSQDKPMGFKSDDSGVLAVTQETDFSSFASSKGSNKHGWHQSFMIHLKDVMKKIKHTLKESKKEDNHSSINTILHGVPSSCKLSTDEKDTPVRLKEFITHIDGKENFRSCHETNDSDNDLSKGRLAHIRRISSLNESVYQYARLFEFSLTKEAKWHDYQSKSLKLTNEDKFPSTGYSFKSFRRRLSLPDLESFCPLPNETSHNSLHSGMPIKTSFDYDTNAENYSCNNLKSVSIGVDRKQFEPPESFEQAELQKNMVEGPNSCKQNENSGDPIVGIVEEISNIGEQYEETVEPEKQKCSPCQDQEKGSAIIFSEEHDQKGPNSVTKEHFKDEITSQTECLVSEGCELESGLVCIDEPNTSVDLQDRSSRGSWTGCSSLDCEKDENAYTMAGDHPFHFESNELDDTDFSYVRDVLEVSGFIEQGCLGTWHSLEQPLSPTLFKELEAYLHRELECSSEDVGSNCDHQLLFDLINEVLLQIYESSLAYFPNSSSTLRLRPLPKGNHTLEEVWKRISRHRSPRLKKEQSLDDIVARDLAKYDNWMNLQLDVEDIALDLEDLIFDELLDEVMRS